MNFVKKTYSTWKSSHLGKVWEQLRICACRAAEMNRSTQETPYYVLEQGILQQTVCELDPAHTCCESVPTNIMTLLKMLHLRLYKKLCTRLKFSGMTLCHLPIGTSTSNGPRAFIHFQGQAVVEDLG